ncbi:1,2-phenylacetyl-CoA epoxidase subunit PaaC [Alteribacillus iranensis]|uniref:Ring-1,2-phenylacetyl-CoA epoxidase subunit PaaC n=1 Tax=Alteribacillus iranensis TaxID=930128 RepID=A0A1I2CSN4_9BACI|nr:1,2-phenylacetyl-CoA epoxidase subunit PaaC [Alteribacillus iranensis]SFE71165.1 ring-1,2-phenylacetyl-CoA epoxidase subunit PaaC [Alteribacillus iranensis]
MTAIETPEQAKQDRTYHEALVDLVYQFADDDFIISFRGSEWLGLAPHIEEDVAFSSITQNTMGHAFLFYQLLEELGEGDANSLAHDRRPSERKNAVYFEKKNGQGTYLEEPYYDWALTVVRQYLYETFKKVKLEAAAKSSYQPLAATAQKILMEQTYHLAHWKMWVTQLQHATQEAKVRIQSRVEEAWKEFGDALELGSKAIDMKKLGLLCGEDELKQKWLQEVEQHVASVPTTPLEKCLGNGRAGEHTEDLKQAINTLSEVYQSDREAVW